MLKSTSSHRSVPTPLHQPPSSYLLEGSIGSAKHQVTVEQLQLLVRRVVVEQRDAQDAHRTRPPTILGTADRRRLLLRKPRAPASDSATAGRYNTAPPGSPDSGRTVALYLYNLCAAHALRSLRRADVGGQVGRRTAPRSWSSGWRASPPRVRQEPREATCLGSRFRGGCRAPRPQPAVPAARKGSVQARTKALALGRQPHSAAASRPDDQPRSARPANEIDPCRPRAHARRCAPRRGRPRALNNVL